MNFAHNDWYQQRYGSAQRQRQHSENVERQAAHFAEIKEQRQARRETYQSNAEAIFAEHGITYEVRGHSWLCCVGTESI